MNRYPMTLLAMAPALALVGCDSQVASGPPEIRLGDSVCAECNMIISDKRWATATVVEGPRGQEPLLFDDFNCQVNYEVEHTDMNILDRWSHSHATGKPIHSTDALFLDSPNLRTPMGSGIAAFASTLEADGAKDELTGEVMDFKTAWERLGHDQVCCAEHSSEDKATPIDLN
ncbi:MAG: hypothetical protein Phyf2KO_07610 [Phycisphaerales bacterium]